MSEHLWIERLNRDIDALLRGEGIERDGSENEEYDLMMHLALTMKTLDLSGECRIQETLKQRLLNQMNVIKTELRNPTEDKSELQDEDLQMAAGGVGPDCSGTSLACPRCGYQGISFNGCPRCGYKKP
ncbi:MAG: hypothetical protein NTX88_03500 [Candidatus Atribacteria bacterium]|nr:hypothetical protein [Candidatus Atribacteria bacterium]